MEDEFKTKKIMTKPLPQILDEIEDSIGKAERAAKEARKAAEEARNAGEKAASEAARVASEAIAEVKRVSDEALKLAKLLDSTMREASAMINERLSAK